MIYLDNSATTKASTKSIEAMTSAMENFFGNPSSLHNLGLEAEKLLKLNRQIIADSIGVKSNEITFNSGGSEGANSVIKGVAKARRREGNKIITSAVEHPAVLETCKSLEQEGFEIVRLPVDRKCNINLDDLKAEVDEKTILISIMTVNNEIGAIMPIDEINSIKGNALFHSDSVQAFGKLNLKGFKGDFLTASGHKLHGPRGIGFQYSKQGAKWSPLIDGGGQEGGLRAGTENLPAIAGFGQATKDIYGHLIENQSHVKQLRDYFKGQLESSLDDILINSPENGIANIFNVSFLGTRGEVLLHTLEQDYIYVSTGSACSSNKKGQSHVLAAMGLKPKEIEGAIRFSFSHYNTKDEIDVVLDKVSQAVKRFRKLGSFR